MCKVMVRVGVKKWLIIERQGRVISGSRVQQKSLSALKPGDRMDGRMGSWEGSYEKRKQAGRRVLGAQVPPRRIEACELGQGWPRVRNRGDAPVCGCQRAKQPRSLQAHRPTVDRAAPAKGYLEV